MCLFFNSRISKYFGYNFVQLIMVQPEKNYFYQSDVKLVKFKQFNIFKKLEELIKNMSNQEIGLQMTHV